MINKVGIRELESLKTEYYRKSTFDLELNINNNMPPISKITSLMASAENIDMEWLKGGVLLTLSYKIKIIYSPIDEDSLHVLEKKYVSLTEIQVPDKIDGDLVKSLIKSKKISPKVDIYEISATHLTDKKIFLKIFSLLRLDYKKSETLALKVINDNLSSNLYITTSDFTSLNQITFDVISTFKEFSFSPYNSEVYFVRSENNTDVLYSYNKRLSQTVLIDDSFTLIQSFSETKSKLLIHGENIFSEGIFSLDKETKTLEHIFNDSLEIQSFVFSSILDKYFILLKDDTNYILKTASENIFSESHSTTLDCTSPIFSDEAEFLVFFDQSSKLNLLDLKSQNTIKTMPLSNFKKIKKATRISKDTVVLWLETLDGLSGLLMFSLSKGNFTQLISKPLRINSLEIDKQRTLLYLSLSQGKYAEIVSLNYGFKNQTKVHLKLEVKNIELKLLSPR